MENVQLLRQKQFFLRKRKKGEKKGKKHRGRNKFI
jgi:hypothetical protein